MSTLASALSIACISLFPLSHHRESGPTHYVSTFGRSSWSPPRVTIPAISRQEFITQEISCPKALDWDWRSQGGEEKADPWLRMLYELDDIDDADVGCFAGLALGYIGSFVSHSTPTPCMFSCVCLHMCVWVHMHLCGPAYGSQKLTDIRFRCCPLGKSMAAAGLGLLFTEWSAHGATHLEWSLL